MEIDEWIEEILKAIEDLKSSNEQWEKDLKKDLKSWRESVRYRVRNLKSRTEASIAEIKREANRGGKSDDGDKDTGRQGEHVEDLLGDAGRVDNETETDGSS